ncbi:glycosyltransferase [Streptomyces sp. NPDC001262]|uniref:glycosyltransferase n=1 Tax=Streptomyces sp. NPDC001262 TaxID=3364552 RepID=UPI00369EC21C
MIFTNSPRKNSSPDVSVVVAVYNAMPYLIECLNSIVCQTVDRRRIEVIAVDDGSTDGSAEELDRFAAEYPRIRVVHQENSGGPSRPRNRALDLARGRYVFVVDADDYLGREALERMLAMAGEQGSDVVLGKVVGVGRGSSVRAYRHADRADLFSSEVYRSLNSMKLIRRSLLERGRIRFPEDLWLGEDQIFMTEVYLAARTISVVGNYDCYFLRRREVGENISARRRTVHERVVHIERVMALVDARVDDPLGRRRLLARHFRALVDKAVLPVLCDRDSDAAERAEVVRRGRVLCRRYWEAGMVGEVSAIAWLRLYCLMEGRDAELEHLAGYRPERDGVGKELVEGGRIYRPYPFFRDAAAGVPDHVFDVTDRLRVRQAVTGLGWDKGRLVVSGYAYVDRVDARQVSTRLVLRRRGGTQQWTVPAESVPMPEPTGEHGAGRYDYSGVGFRAVVGLDRVAAGGGLGRGVWDVYVQVEAQGVVKEARLALPESGGWQLPGGRDLSVPAVSAVAYRTKGGKLAVDVGGVYHRLTPRAVLASMGWSGDLLHLRGSCRVENVPGAAVGVEAFLRHRATDAEVLLPTTFEAGPTDTADTAGSAPAGTAADVGFQAVVDPLAADAAGPLSSGVWDVWVRLCAPGVLREVRLKTADELPVGDLWRLRVLPGAQCGGVQLVTPYLTMGRHAALDVGGCYFTAQTQVLVSRVRRHPGNRQEVIVQGRVGVQGLAEGGLRVEVVDRRGNRSQAVARLVPTDAEDPLPKVVGREHHTGRWQLFTAVVPMAVRPRFAHGVAEVRVHLTVSGRTLTVRHSCPSVMPAAPLWRGGTPSRNIGKG